MDLDSTREKSKKNDFVAIELKILSFWKEKKIFEKHVEKNRNGKIFVFYEGPPTANGKPGIHHVLSRVYKDIYIRYYGLKGYHIPRKAGWDCHGLPVEREIEKELNIQSKAEIEEKYGLEEFNRLCRESVLRYVDAWKEFSERLGFWIDFENAYFTMDNEYIESVWYLLKEIYKKGLLYKGYKVVPYDPVMGTTVSDAEVALGYREVVDPSLTVKFRILDPRFENTFFLVWTTTPWTLPANVALALHPEEKYVWIELPRKNRERYILAKALLEVNLQHLPEEEREYILLKEFAGKELQNISYERLMDFLPLSGEEKKKAFYTVTAEFVTMDTGTGIVHIAPAYGAEDLEVGLSYDLPILYGAQLDGKFHEGPYKGLFFKDADKEIIKDLKKQNKVWKSEQYKHDYPFGWRSGAPLMYYAKEAWYIKTTSLKDKLIENNREINWIPSHIKEGRFGNWLENNKDWALSRERYWGTPLPIWMDEEGNIECIGSLKELEEKTQRDLSHLDLHRPYIDEITWTDPVTKKTFRRVPEVIDCWFDSGAMPYAQWGWPHRNIEEFEKYFPADFISEAVDQTRGWFYTLLAISTIISGRSSYKNVVCLGHVLDAKGEKMSKSKGNTVDPWEVFHFHGADAIRWYFLTGAPPGNSRRIGKPNQPGDPLFQVQGFFRMILNSLEFFRMYAEADKITYEDIKKVPETIPFSVFPEIDRWLLSYLQELIKITTEHLDQFDCLKPGKLIEEFVDSLSNWYIRRNRRRFWKEEKDTEKLTAYYTLYTGLLTLARLMSPYTPFLSEHVFLELRDLLGAGELPESIHLMDWPEPDFQNFYEKEALERGNIIQLVAFLGRSARQKAKIKIRQPLKKIYIYSPKEYRDIITNGQQILLEELNVKEMEFIDDSSNIFYYQVKPNLPVLGKKYGNRIKIIQEFLKTTDHDAIVKILENEGYISIIIDGKEEKLGKEDFLIEGISREGTQGAESKGFVVAIETEITKELYLEGLARDLIRNIQEARKKAKLHITDRIYLGITTSRDDILQAIEYYRPFIENETLSKLQSITDNADYRETIKIDNYPVTIEIKKML